MHFSDQQPGSSKKMLVFKFALPDENNMVDMTRLVALVPYYIDLIGRYKLSSHVSIPPYFELFEYLGVKGYLSNYYELHVRLNRKQKQPEQRLPRSSTKNFSMPGKTRCRKRRPSRERSWRRQRRSWVLRLFARKKLKTVPAKWRRQCRKWRWLRLTRSDMSALDIISSRRWLSFTFGLLLSPMTRRSSYMFETVSLVFIQP